MPCTGACNFADGCNCKPTHHWTVRFNEFGSMYYCTRCELWTIGMLGGGPWEGNPPVPCKEDEDEPR